VKRALMQELPKQASGVIYELGCGWGGLAIALAKRYPEQQVVGYELSPLPYLVSLIRKWVGGHRNLRIYRRNFFREDLFDAGLVVCYLYRKAMRRLEEVLPTTVVVTHTFGLGDAKPVRVCNDLYRTPIYRVSWTERRPSVM
jgi:predicted RNA methylase